jgi:DNA-binding transcriptional LysR family regulator
METITPRFDWAMAFLTAVEKGSFTKAADTLGCSKSYLSKQVSQLEKALGVQLLYRTTRRIALTEAGSTYLEYCKQLKRTLQEAERTVSGLRHEIAGRLRISAPNTFAHTNMADMLMAFRQRYPAVDIELDLNRRAHDLIIEGYDAAIRTGHIQDDRLLAKPLGVQEDWLVASPGLLQRLGMPAVPHDLLDKPCLINSQFMGENKWLFLHGEERETVEIAPWLAINDYQLIRCVALANGGFARLPRYLVEPDVRTAMLVRVLAEYQLPHTPLFLVFPQRQPQPPQVRVLIDFVDAWFNPRR